MQTCSVLGMLVEKVYHWVCVYRKCHEFTELSSHLEHCLMSQGSIDVHTPEHVLLHSKCCANSQESLIFDVWGCHTILPFHCYDLCSIIRQSRGKDGTYGPLETDTSMWCEWMDLSHLDKMGNGCKMFSPDTPTSHACPKQQTSLNCIMSSRFSEMVMFVRALRRIVLRYWSADRRSVQAAHFCVDNDKVHHECCCWHWCDVQAVNCVMVVLAIHVLSS